MSLLRPSGRPSGKIRSPQGMESDGPFCRKGTAYAYVWQAESHWPQRAEVVWGEASRVTGPRYWLGEIMAETSECRCRSIRSGDGWDEGVPEA